MPNGSGGFSQSTGGVSVTTGGSTASGTGGVSPAGGSPTGGASQAGAPSSGGSAGGGGFPPLTANVTLHVAGDSTAAIFAASDPTGRVGWAAVLQQFFGTGVQVNDAAMSGRSSKSFIDEGLWTTLKAKIRTGDYVFIQFAHNWRAWDR